MGLDTVNLWGLDSYVEHTLEIQDPTSQSFIGFQKSRMLSIHGSKYFFFVPKMQDKSKKKQEICTWFGVVNVLLCNTISVFSKSLTDLLPFSECSHLHGLVVNAWSNPAGPFGGLQRLLGKWENLRDNNLFHVPSRGLTYPTLGKGKSSSKCHFWGIC